MRSLQATWIRNTAIHALRSSSTVKVHDIPSTFVYNNPTITALAAYVNGILTGTLSFGEDAERAAAIARMRAMLDMDIPLNAGCLVPITGMCVFAQISGTF